MTTDWNYVAPVNRTASTLLQYAYDNSVTWYDANWQAWQRPYDGYDDEPCTAAVCEAERASFSPTQYFSFQDVVGSINAQQATLFPGFVGLSDATEFLLKTIEGMLDSNCGDACDVADPDALLTKIRDGTISFDGYASAVAVSPTGQGKGPNSILCLKDDDTHARDAGGLVFSKVQYAGDGNCTSGNLRSPANDVDDYQAGENVSNACVASCTGFGNSVGCSTAYDCYQYSGEGNGGTGMLTQTNTPTFAGGGHSAGSAIKVPTAAMLAVGTVTYVTATLTCSSSNTRGLSATGYTFAVAPSSPAGSSVIYTSTTGSVNASLAPLTTYTAICTVTTSAGSSPASSTAEFTTSLVQDCTSAGCVEYATCNSATTLCECEYDYVTEVVPMSETRACSELWTPCSSSSNPCLGPFGACGVNSGYCECEPGTVIAALARSTLSTADAFAYAGASSDIDATSAPYRTCLAEVASIDDARKFWAVSLWLSVWGLVASSWVIWEFMYNSQLKHPNSMMQMFVAFAVPDFLLALLNFASNLDALIDGEPLGSVTGDGGRDDMGCRLASFFTYTLVTCTYFAPMWVALITFLKFNAVSQGKAFVISSTAIYAMGIAAPLVLGAALAGGAWTADADDGQSVLGNYRGLYCYVRRWEYSMTGLALIVIFCIAMGLTLLLYLLTTLKVVAIVKNKTSAGAANAPKAIMKRGLLLTMTFLGCWMWFVTTGGLAYQNRILDINIDLVGAVIVHTKPIIDAVILLTMPNIRMEYLSRWLKQGGGSVASSSSTSAPTYSSSSSSSQAAATYANRTAQIAPHEHKRA